MLNLFREKHQDVHHYRIMAMSQTFVYYSIDTTIGLSYNISINNQNSYIKFKVIGESASNNKLTESNEVNISCSDIENFKITALNWYRGTTLAFRSKWVYDLYKIYDKNGLVATTEDPILQLLHKVTKNKLDEIIVEWYIKEDNTYVLGWVSDGIDKLPERKESKYKISVIIPVYNAEVFLPRTIDSILSSSMDNIELILVDDGSTDNSLDICKWYAKNFPCISIIQQKNQRVAIARNSWVSAAKWEYLWFVDNDDIVHPFMYEKLYYTCKLKDTDIAIAPTIIRNDINNKEICLKITNKNENIVTYTYDEVINNMHKKDNIYFVAVRNKIVKTEIAKKVKFPTEYPNNIVLYEDSAYTPLLYSYADKFSFSKDEYYIWDKRKQKTLGTATTMHRNENADNVWKTFIYAHSYPIYNGCKKHKKLCDYACFKRIIESYDKFNTPSPLLDYWNEKLTELIDKEKLYENALIMADNHLSDIVNRLKLND